MLSPALLYTQVFSRKRGSRQVLTQMSWTLRQFNKGFFVAVFDKSRYNALNASIFLSYNKIRFKRNISTSSRETMDFSRFELSSVQITESVLIAGNILLLI